MTSSLVVPPLHGEGSIMAILSEITEMLRRWDVWKRVEAAPDRIDELEKRVAALEQRPNLPLCEKCGVGYMRLDRAVAPSGPFSVFEGTGMQIKIYKCDKCGIEIRKEPDDTSQTPRRR
jgi:hypothetical protein